MPKSKHEARYMAIGTVIWLAKLARCCPLQVLDEINEQTDQMQQIQDAMAQPIGPAADVDEDELMGELEVTLSFQGMFLLWCAYADTVHISHSLTCSIPLPHHKVACACCWHFTTVDAQEMVPPAVAIHLCAPSPACCVHRLKHHHVPSAESGVRAAG